MKLHLPNALFTAVLACMGMAYGATLDAPTGTVRTININFNSGSGSLENMEGYLTIGAVTTNAANWNNLTGATGNNVAVTSTDGTGYMVSYSSPNTWSDGDPSGSLIGALTNGYLDVANDGSSGAAVSILNTDGSALTDWYQVNIIMSGDGQRFSPVTVNGTDYVYASGTLSWGTRSSSDRLEEGVNVVSVKAGSAPTGLEVVGGSAGTSRASIAGVQVVLDDISNAVYRITDFHEGETASLNTLAGDRVVTGTPIQVNVTSTSNEGDTATLTIDRELTTEAICAKGGSLSLEVTENASIGALTTEEGGSIGCISIAGGKTLALTNNVSAYEYATTGTGKLELHMADTPASKGVNLVKLDAESALESVRIASGVFAVNTNNSASNTSRLGSVDLVMGDGTTYVVRNGIGGNADVTTGTIRLEGGMDLQVYGSVGDTVISTSITKADGATRTSINKTDGGTVTLSGTVDTTAITVSGGKLKLTGTITADNLYTATGTVEIASGTTTVSQVRQSEGGQNGNKLVISGGTLKITGSTNNHSASDSLLLAYKNRTSFLEVNGGTLDAVGAVALMGGSGTGTMSINGGTAKLQGLNFWAGGVGVFRGTFNLGTADSGDGTLELGYSGFANIGAGATVNLGNGTIKAVADTSMRRNTVYDSGTVNLIGTNGGTRFDTNGYNININDLDVTGSGDLVKSGAGTLTFNGMLEAGAITVEEGTLQFNQATTISATIINDGTISFGSNGSLAVASLGVLDAVGAKTYSDGDNGYVNASYTVIKTSGEGKTSTVSGLDTLTVGKESLTLRVGDNGERYVDHNGTSGSYYVNTGDIVYADNTQIASSDTTDITMNGGSLTVQKDLEHNIVLLKDASVNISQEATVNNENVVHNGNTLTISGSGRYETGSAAGISGTVAGDWTGTVSLKGVEFDGSNRFGALKDLATADSWIELDSCTGYLYRKNGDSSPSGYADNNGNLELKANLIMAEGTALSITNGNSDSTAILSGTIKGTGAVEVTWPSGQAKYPTPLTTIFSGDTSGWTGDVTADISERVHNIIFSGTSDISNKNLKATNGTLNVTIGGDNTMGRSIASNITQDGGTVNLTTSGTSEKTFTGKVSVATISVTGGAVTFTDAVSVGGNATFSSLLTLGAADSLTVGDTLTVNGLELLTKIDVTGVQKSVSYTIATAGSLVGLDTITLDKIMTGTLAEGVTAELVFGSAARTAGQALALQLMYTPMTPSGLTVTGATWMGDALQVAIAGEIPAAGELAVLVSGEMWKQMMATVAGAGESVSQGVLFKLVSEDGSEIDMTNYATVTFNGYAGAGNGQYAVIFIPEPTTATLSLLALAGLASSRRRK